MGSKKYEIIYDFLEAENVKSLKKRAKKLNLKRYSKLKKKELIRLIINEYACRSIQRYIRKNYLSIELDTCPISQESWVYPMFPKKSKQKFIYYNIEPLVEYIITVGKEDAVDPLTREKYTNKDLDLIHNLNILSGSKVNFIQKINRKHFYQKRKEEEDRIDICINEIRSQANIIKELIEQYTYNFLRDTAPMGRRTPPGVHTAPVRIAETPFDLLIAMNSIDREFEELKRYIRYLYHKSKPWTKKVFDMVKQIIHPQSTEGACAAGAEDTQNFFISKLLELIKLEENKYAF